MTNDVSPPGEILAEALEERNMSIDDLAKQIGLSEGYIRKLINGKAVLFGFTADKLERALDIPADFWRNMEHNYRESLKGKP